MLKLELYNDINLYVALLKNVKNMSSIRNRVLKGELNCGLIKPTLIVDPLQISVASYKSYQSKLNQEMSTKNIYSELLFNLSPSKNISQSLNKFGISDTDEDGLLVIIGDDATAEDVTEEFNRYFTDLKQLQTLNDLELIKKTYGISDKVLKVSNLKDAVVTRISTKQCVL